MPVRLPRPAARIRALLSDERGFSLTEMLVGAGLGVVVLGVPLTLGTEAFIGQNNASSRSAATNRLEVGIAALLRDLRHATAATIHSSGGVASATLTVPIRHATGGVSPTPVDVVWTCTPSASCTRKVGAAVATEQIPWLVSASFAPVSKTGATTVPQSNPAYVGVTLSVLVSDEQGRDHSKAALAVTKPIAVTDGVALRNFAS
jgi:hypothetical protein